MKKLDVNHFLNFNKRFFDQWKLFPFYHYFTVKQISQIWKDFTDKQRSLKIIQHFMVYNFMKL